jgi:hypothetical protein
LELGAGALDPRLVEGVALLGTVTTFERVPGLLAFFTRVRVGEDTARRLTEAAGAAQVALEAAEAARLERELPVPPPGPAVQQLSLDGAMVPLVGGEWAEVKTLALGTVGAAIGADGTPSVRTTELSYCSRLADAETFRRLARVELHRRGTEAAGTVCAVQDGAEWQQRFVDVYRPDAVRILDFPHAGEHVATAARAVFGAGTAALSEWLGPQLHELKHGDPDRVLAALRRLPAGAAADPATATASLAEVLGYLEKRRAQLAYAAFRARGYPIGSGAVESANKLVVEARLKGSGMHWARGNVNPLVALRAVLCSARWDAAWPPIWAQLRRDTAARRRRLRAARQPAAVPRPAPAPASPPPAPVAAPPAPRQKLVLDGRPTAQHPWRKPFLPRRPASPLAAKT